MVNKLFIFCNILINWEMKPLSRKYSLDEACDVVLSIVLWYMLTREVSKSAKEINKLSKSKCDGRA